MKKVVVISTSLRPGSNSNALAERFAGGAKEAGNEVEFISLRGKEIKFSCSKDENNDNKIAIENKPTKEIVWGNNAFTLTAAVEPANATDPITWTCTTNNAVFINNNEEQVATINGIQCSVLVTGTGSVSITATVGDVSDTYTFSVSADYVDLSGDGSLYYYTKEKGDGVAYYWSDREKDLPAGARVAEADELRDLIDGVYVLDHNDDAQPLIYVTNTNGSGANITLRTSVNYWSNTPYPPYEGAFVQFYYNADKDSYTHGTFGWENGREKRPMILVRNAD